MLTYDAFDKDNYYIKITLDKDNRILRVIDTGIGMTREELRTTWNHRQERVL